MSVEQKLSELKEEFNHKLIALVEENTGLWRPQIDERFSYIYYNGIIFQSRFNLSKEYLRMFEIGNCFKTREEAEFMLERLRVINELKQYSTPYQGRENSWFIALDEDTNKLGAYYNYCRIGLVLYFESKEKVKEAIETVGEERILKYYLQVKED